MNKQRLQAFIAQLKQQQRSRVEQLQSHLTETDADLPQTAPWAQRLTWTMLASLAIALTWSVLAKIDVVVAARGKLEPQSSSQTIQARQGGVVTAVLVKEGQAVQQGTLLIQLDKSELLNQLKALAQQRQPIAQQLTILQAARQNQPIDPAQLDRLKLPPELLTPIQNRTLLQAQLSGNPVGLTAEQTGRYLLFAQAQQDAQLLGQLETNALQVQAAGTDSQLATTETQLRLEQAQLEQLQSLVQEGAISQVSFLERVTAVNGLQNQLNQQRLQQTTLKLNGLESQLKSRTALQDLQRQTQSELAQLDTELDSKIEQSKQQLVQLDAQIQQVQLSLQAQDLRSPVDGVVFNLVPKIPGMVTQAGQALLQVTPKEGLVAQLQVANTDITHLAVGDTVRVRVDAYPFTDFGDIPGTVTRIGSEAVPLNQNQATGQTFFPVEVRLDEPFLEHQGQRYPLAPGMTLTANVTIDSRPPIRYVADYLIQAFDGMRSVH